MLGFLACMSGALSESYLFLLAIPGVCIFGVVSYIANKKPDFFDPVPKMSGIAYAISLERYNNRMIEEELKLPAIDPEVSFCNMEE